MEVRHGLTSVFSDVRDHPIAVRFDLESARDLARCEK
jgi:hypothetical protein